MLQIATGYNIKKYL